MGRQRIQQGWHLKWGRAGWIVRGLALTGLLLALLGLRPGQAQDNSAVALVQYARSGHTLELLSELSPAYPVMQIRLAGITAPELQQHPWGQAARQCLADQVNNTTVRVEPQGMPDPYGRLWAHVWVGNQWINRAMLAQGCALLADDRLPQQPDPAALVYAQELARLQGVGIWDPAQPLRESPTAFRQRLAAP